MKEKITITVCTGTTCFLMGSSDLMLISDRLPEALKDKIEVRGSVCLDYCQNTFNEKAPFVEIDGKKMSDANIPKVIKQIENILKGTL